MSTRVKRFYRTLVLSGGGILGSLHIGFIQALQEDAHLNVKKVIGTSVGSLIGLMYCIGLNTEEMTRKFCCLRESILKMNQLYHVFETWGMDNGEYFKAHLYDMLIEKDMDPKITFEQLYEITGKTLVVTVTNLSSHETEYLCRYSHPTMQVVEAVRCSCTIPILAMPVRGTEGQIWVDGGVIMNYPDAALSEDEAPYAIGCRLVSWKPNAIVSFQDYLMSLIGCMLRKEYAAASENKCATITIDCSDVNFFDFNQATEDRKGLIERGRRKTAQFLQQTNTAEKRRSCP